MHYLKKSIEIDAPVSQVFEYLTEPTHLPGIWPSMIEVRNIERQGDGAHSFDWTYKMGGLRFDGHSATHALTPARFVEVVSRGGIPSVFRWTYDGANGAGTQLTVEVEYNIPIPVVTRFAEAVVTRMNARELDIVLANAKSAIESQRAARARTESLAGK